ncbi:MAG: nucleotidyltransferase substrate binding protein [Chitinispirillia bacterium]|nr:nucleotidyltransferase substrate binding protein [Chitinispirillia bacterium]MCL2267693.1 nucleotidyltransferase substrate binding protein [Chitinispirillia bacterium]
MADADIRWKQRFANYKKAHGRLRKNVVFFENNRSGDDLYTAMEALIKCFEFTFELAWQTMKDYISYNGYSKDINGSRDSIRAAIQFDLTGDGQLWIDMVSDRNRAAHAYDEENAMYLADRIIEHYTGEFAVFEEKMGALL